MSFYQLSPFKPVPKLLVQGTPEYLFGSFNSDTGPCLGNVISDSAVTTTGTVTFQILSGNIPTVDSLITVVGTANGGGNFNVTNASILSVSTTTAGMCTVTYTITSTTQGTVSDAGQVYIAQREIGDVLTVAAASAPVCSPVAGPNSIGKSLSVTVKLPASTTANPSTISAVTVVVQGANVDLDSEYSTIGTVGTALAAGSTTEWQSGQGVNDDSTGSLAGDAVNLINFRFYRINTSALTGTGPIIAKILQ